MTHHRIPLDLAHPLVVATGPTYQAVIRYGRLNTFGQTLRTRHFRHSFLVLKPNRNKIRQVIYHKIALIMAHLTVYSDFQLTDSSNSYGRCNISPEKLSLQIIAAGTGKSDSLIDCVVPHVNL